MNMVQARVLSHDELSGGYRVLTFEAPGIAGAAAPGQFVHLRISGLPQVTLRRPFSIYRAEQGQLAILYKCVGVGTRAMLRLAAGDEVSLMGPLGREFPIDASAQRHPVLVAGGYGVAPLSFLARRLPCTGTVFIGGGTSGDLLCLEEFAAMGWDVRTTTEDGSAGAQGLVTDALSAWLAERADTEEPEFFACGPYGMLHAVGGLAEGAGATAWVSLDRHMGCGAGACLACVVKVKKDGGSAWARVCLDGPVFDSRDVVWDKGEP